MSLNCSRHFKLCAVRFDKHKPIEMSGCWKELRIDRVSSFLEWPACRSTVTSTQVTSGWVVRRCAKAILADTWSPGNALGRSSQNYALSY